VSGMYNHLCGCDLWSGRVRQCCLSGSASQYFRLTDETSILLGLAQALGYWWLDGGTGDGLAKLFGAGSLVTSAADLVLFLVV